MKQRWLGLIVAGLLLAALLGWTRTRAADGGYTLLRGSADQSSVVTTAPNGGYQLTASLGQPFASTRQGGPLWMGGGYWYGGGGSLDRPLHVYIPLITR
jgi:hypothetical protein